MGQQEQALPFMSHLTELRRRLIWTVVIIAIAFFACFNYSDILYHWLIKPMHESIVLSIAPPYISFLPREKVYDLVFLAPAEAFWTHMKVALIAAIAFTAPLLFWQVWAFISPGLLKKEKRMAIPFVGVTSILFLVGVSFCFMVVLPFAMNFLLNFRTESLTPMISVEKYVDFCLKFILAFGAIFELPVIIVFLSRLGIITPQALAKNRKYSVLVAFIVAAVLTPTPDAFNQTLMAGPIIILYEIGILAARLLGRKKPVEQEEEASSQADAQKSAQTSAQKSAQKSESAEDEAEASGQTDTEGSGQDSSQDDSSVSKD